jgi:hypothetical protein
MDYEKKYKEALELMKDCVPDENGLVHVRPCDIFTELAEVESEDEKMRGAAMAFVSGCKSFVDYYGISQKAVLAWLEKQGEQNTTKGYSTLEITDVVRQALQECESFSNIRADVYAARVGATVEKLIKKQGEQKHTVEEVLIKAGLKPYKDGNQWCVLLGDNIQEGICGFGDTIDDALYAFLNDLIKSQKEQKPVELPKVKSVPLSFKEKLGIFMHYTSVDLEKEENQQLLDEAAKELLQLAYSDKANEIALASAKTWEESMAILIASNNAYKKGQKEQKPDDKAEPKFHEGEWIVRELDNTCYQIKKCILNVTNNKYGYDLTSGGYISSQDANFYHRWTIQDAKDGDVLLSPSTPEGDKECPFIFKEIDKSGIVRCHAALLQSESLKIDDGITNVMGYANAGYHVPATKEHRDALMKAMTDAGYTFDFEKKELKKVEQKPAEWSEEDEDMRYKATVVFNRLCAKGEEYVWSVETLKKIFYWLKSLRPQNRWKPDSSMLICLEYAIKHINKDGDKRILSKLLELLKKLTE